MDRKEKEFNEELDYLMSENAKMRKKLGLPSDEDLSDEDISIVDDDE